MDERIGHTPVLTRAVRELLAVRAGETVVDATVGLAGHASHFAEEVGAEGTLVGLDADPQAVAASRERLRAAACRAELVQANFADLPAVLASVGLDRVDVLFADLGLNSRQLDDAARGFSFQGDGPLDMRLSPDLKETAADLINRLKEKELGDLLYFNAQEFAARRIARRICHVRRDGRITTTAQLAEVVCRALDVNPHARRAKIHPATRTFLALRIAVNREFEGLEAFLNAAPGVLRPGGRIGVISFHSGEDKRVKVDFRDRMKRGEYTLVTKKPVIADAEERRLNPRSRSAKLRVARRTQVEI